MDIIIWMNSNQGFVAGILTLVTALTTLITVILMYHSNRTASNSLAHAVWLEDNRSRPFLTFDIEYSDKCIFAVLKNIGLSPAVNVKVKINPELQKTNQDGLRFEIGMTKYSLSQFLPGQNRRDLIDAGHIFFQHYKGNVLCGVISYSDVSGKNYEEKISIDLEFMFNLQDIEIPSLNREVEKIRIANELVVQKISNLESSISNYLKYLQKKDM